MTPVSLSSWESAPDYPLTLFLSPNPQILLTLRARGYAKVLAVFEYEQQVAFVERRCVGP